MDFCKQSSSPPIWKKSSRQVSHNKDLWTFRHRKAHRFTAKDHRTGGQQKQTTTQAQPPVSAPETHARAKLLCEATHIGQNMCGSHKSVNLI